MLEIVAIITTQIKCNSLNYMKPFIVISPNRLKRDLIIAKCLLISHNYINSPLIQLSQNSIRTAILINVVSDDMCRPHYQQNI